MAHLVHVRIKNFGPFRGVHELDLGSGCYGIFARHVDNANRSNGLGKSFFLGAIRWCLEGKRIEGVDSLDELISEGEDEMAVELRFSNSLHAVRSKKQGKSTAFNVRHAGTAKASDEAQEHLDRVLGISVEDRLSTSWAMQKELDVLTRDSTTSSMLTAMVERWLGHELVKLTEAEDAVSDFYSDAVDAHEDAVRELDAVVDAESKIDEARSEHARFKKNYDADVYSYEARQASFNQFESRRVATRNRDVLEGLRHRLKELEAREFGGGDSEELRKQATGVRALASKKSQEMKLAALEVERLNELVSGEFDGACPVSEGFECPAVARINKRKNENRASLEQAKAKHRGLKDEFLKLDAEASALVAKTNKSLEGETAKVQNEASKAALRDRIEALQKEVDEAKQNGICVIDGDEDVPERPRYPNMEDVTRAKLEVERLERIIASRPDVEKRVKETADAVRAYKLSCDILGPTMARRMLTERSVKKITAEANARLHDAGVTLTVKDAWGRETGVLAEQCSACGEKFPKSAKVKACERCGALRGNKIEHEFKWKLSFRGGAAKDLGGLGLRIAGHNWLRTKRGAAWSIAVLDEPTAQMDRAHRSAVAAAIRKLLVGSFEQAFITAHDASTLESCEKKIFIEGHGAEPVRSTIKVI